MTPHRRDAGAIEVEGDGDLSHAVFLLNEFRQTLPVGHQELPGVIRSIEVLTQEGRGLQ
jgi:hypothetical protein